MGSSNSKRMAVEQPTSYPNPSNRTTGPTDEEILNFENQIREEQINSQPLITVPLPLAILRDEYNDELGSPPNFLKKISEIEEQFTLIRKTRGDGNCFFRAFSFGLVEELRKLPIERRASTIEKLKDQITEQLKKVGFEAMAYEDFYDELFLTLEEAQKNGMDWLQEEWQSQPHRSHSLVVLMRLLTSAQIRLNSSNYEPFIWDLDAGGIQQFCQRYVECIGVESDQIHIIALGRSLGCKIEIAYLDASEGPLSRLMFGEEEGSDLKVYVLYRPGHYDLLYPS